MAPGNRSRPWSDRPWIALEPGIDHSFFERSLQLSPNSCHSRRRLHHFNNNVCMTHDRLSVLCFCTLIALPSLAANNDWPSVGGDKGFSRHSPLTQITP